MIGFVSYEAKIMNATSILSRDQIVEGIGQKEGALLD